MGEKNIVAMPMDIVDKLSKAKRVAATVNDSVEKFHHRDLEGGAVWGKTVSKMDMSGATLFAHLWLLDTYAKKAAEKQFKIREVWNNLDGTRSQQFTVHHPGFPGQDIQGLANMGGEN